jgi:ABC-type glycerol-3-phosphate transport system permease component
MAQVASTSEVPLSLPRMNYRRAFSLLITYSVLVVAVMIIVFPVFWMASSSLKPATELFARNMTLLPVNWSLENYANVWLETPFPSFFWNSFKVATISTICAVVVSVYAAYALARVRFRGRYLYGMLLLITQMFPHILIVIPLFLIVRKLGLLNTHAALILAYTAFSLPFSIWLLRGFFEAIP